MKTTFLLAAIALTMGLAPTAGADEGAKAARNTSTYNLQSGVGLKGFDPVAVFPEGGGAARMGRAELAVELDGVVYRFASENHRAMFLANPDRYEPTYGGWCAYAMSYGSQVDIQPQLYTLAGNRAHYFVSARAKRSFDTDIASHEQRADAHWMKISGEMPRR